MKKLVRDNIPEMIMDSGSKCKVEKSLDIDKKRELLIEKFKEEVDEFLVLVESDTIESPAGELEELADIYQVCVSYAKHILNLPTSAVRDTCYEKEVRCGGFDKFYIVDFSEKE